MEYGLIGEHLGHSYSGIIHQKLGEYEYRICPLAPSQLNSFMTRKEFAGINVTIPYKQAVMPFCDEIDSKAQQIGAVNTILNQKGRLLGYNTDYDGFSYLLQSGGISVRGKRVLLLGNGATTKTVMAVMQDLGAESVLVASRSPKPGIISYQQALLEKAVQIIVNCSPAGMFPNNGQTLLNLQGFPALEAVVDVVYNPFVTELLRQAKELGLKTANGLGMLVAQAGAAASLFTGGKPLLASVPQVVFQLEQQLGNITLIGMPGCGKTTLGRMLAKKLGKTFVDLDHEIVKQAGQSIPEIFAQQGEQAFRTLETQAAQQAGKQRGCVISSGGGVVKNPLNMRALSQNGPVLFIDCPPESLPVTKGRPLAKNLTDLQRLYQERLPLYRQYADETVPYHADITVNLERLLQAAQQTLQKIE